MTRDANEDDLSLDRLNAFVDGELDALDAGRVLDAMQRDPVLARRACELRLTKDLVRHAYPIAAGNGDRGHRGFGRRWWALAAAAVFLVAIGAGGGWASHAWTQDDDYSQLVLRAGAVAQTGAPDHVLLHVSSSAPERVAAMLDETEGMLAAARRNGRSIAIEILANSSGLDVLRPDASPAAARLESLRAEYPNLTLVACGQTIERLREKGVTVHLVPDATVASSALDEVVKRIHEGWTYVRT
jgi:intracellular sulfur oxidation DsrE/DsrF family protein